MTTEMRQKVLQLVEHLPSENLPQAIAFLESLAVKAGNIAPNVNGTDEEKRLLTIIQRHLSPPEQKRFEALREQNEWGTLTAAEHQELIKYIEKIEDQDVERTAALIQLAKLRNVSLDELLKLMYY